MTTECLWKCLNPMVKTLIPVLTRIYFKSTAHRQAKALPEYSNKQKQIDTQPYYRIHINDSRYLKRV
jgi:hypothetical protein